MRYTFTMEGIDCGHCATKLEGLLKKDKRVKDASIQFILKKVEVDTYDVLSIDKARDVVQCVANQVEDGITILPSMEQVSSPSPARQTKKVIGTAEKSYGLWGRFLASILLLLVGSLWEMDLFIIVAYFVMGYDVLFRAAKNTLKGKVFDEHFLMSIATLAAFVIGEYAEAVAVMLFYQVGEYFQNRAVTKSRDAIASLMAIKPEVARVRRDNTWVEVSPEEVCIGDTVQVRAGEKIPLDGIVVKGVTTIDTSMLTGESVPVCVEEQMQVMSGTINIESMIEVVVTHTAKDSTVSKVLDMVAYASTKKAVAEQFITKFASKYTPTVVCIALFLAVFPPLVVGDWEAWVYRSIVFLVISCPCALVVSVPLSFFGGIGAASRHGILVKGSNYLERLSTIDTVVLDKTGTITKGQFEVTDIILAEGVEEQELLMRALSVEEHSNHPIAKAIVKYIHTTSLQTQSMKDTVQDSVEQAGYGITAKVGEIKVFAGNKKLMEREGVAYEEINKIGTWVYIATEKGYMGAIGVMDVVKTDTKQAIERLRERGIEKIVMLTGDKKEVAEAIGEEVGIRDIQAELLPQDKVRAVEKLISEGASVVFVGDGINDAPALTLADVGVAMGGIGSDAAVEASDMVIMTDSLLKISTGIDIAKNTKQIVLQNIIFAIGVKMIVMLLGILGIANMWLAIFADMGVSVIAILNAIRALTIKVDR